ncbi:hypothetical protein D7241_19745 [Stutzerimonas sp. VN223-3]
MIGVGYWGNAEAAIESNCSANLGGAVSCEFTNTGAKKDGACIVMEVVRSYDAKNYSYPSMGGKGAVLTSNKICSGLVEAGDIRERNPEVTWNIGERVTSPMGFCASDNPWFKASNNCTIQTKEIPL